MQLDGVALRGLEWLRRDGELSLDLLQEASCVHGSVLPAEGVGGINGLGRAGKFRGKTSGLAQSEGVQCGWDSRGEGLAVGFPACEQ